MAEEDDWAFELALTRTGDNAREDAWLIDRGWMSRERAPHYTLEGVHQEAAECRAIGAANVVIGLFGTCGGSRWRDAFIKRFTMDGVKFFNPQVENWTPLCAVQEAKHLTEDLIILFPVTSETYGCGSLAEIGFAALQVVKSDGQRDLVVMVASDLDPSLDNPVAKKESSRTRTLVAEHLKKLGFSNIHVVDSLERMLELSLRLHKAAMPRAYYRSLHSNQQTN